MGFFTSYSGKTGGLKMPLLFSLIFLFITSTQIHARFYPGYCYDAGPEDLPEGFLPSSTGPFAYIPNLGDNNVSVLDLSTNTVVTTIAVGVEPIWVAVDKATNKVYIANQGSDNVSIINTSTNMVENTIAVGDFPTGLALSPDGTRLYVADQSDDQVRVLNTSDFATVATVSTGSRPFGVVVSEDGSRVYSANREGNSVTVIDANTNMAITTVSVSSGPQVLAFNPAGTKLFVSNALSGSISVIDVATNTVTNTISVGGFPRGMVIGGVAFDKLYVSNDTQGTINVIDLATEVAEPSISIEVGMVGIDASIDGSTIYATNRTTDLVYVVDPASGTSTSNIAVGDAPASYGNFILVENMQLPGDSCAIANDINDLFGGDVNVPVISDVQDNTGYNPDNDPGVGYECFAGNPVLNNTIWYTFTGDGNIYSIRSIQCGDENPMTNTDTQFALYSGDCENPTPVACNDDEDFDNQVYNSYIEIETEPGVNYILMVDGYGSPNDYFAIGEFCIEVTNLTEPVELTTVTFQVDASLLVADGTVSAEGIFLAGGFNDFTGEPMNEGTENVWTLTLDIEPGTYTYKFQNGPGGWENIDTSIGDDCTVGGYGDREVVVEDMEITTDLVCFAYCVTCDMLVDTDEAALQAGISVFPNPAKEVLNVQIDLPEAAASLCVRMVNALGQVVSEQYLGQLQSDNIELDVSKVPVGTYMLQVRDGASQYTQAVIVQR